MDLPRLVTCFYGWLRFSPNQAKIIHNDEENKENNFHKFSTTTKKEIS